MLEVLFPNSIDSMKKERSYDNGMMPIVLESNDPVHLAILLMDKNEQEGERLVGDFGCNTVILVKD